MTQLLGTRRAVAGETERWRTGSMGPPLEHLPVLSVLVSVFAPFMLR